MIDTFPVSSIFMPNVEGSSEHYTKLLSSIEKQGLSITTPIVESIYQIGESSFMIVAPHGTDYESLNDYSIGIKLTYGNVSFLMTADAQAPSEQEMLQSGIDLSAEVMKINHHGSVTSNTTDFINTVNPSHVIISAGTANKYEHPHSAVMKDIYNRKLSLYRTDKQGTIVVSSDGDNIVVNVTPYQITKADMTSDAAEVAAIKKGY